MKVDRSNGPRTILQEILIEPTRAYALSPSDWDTLVPVAREQGLLAKIEARLSAQTRLECLPRPVGDHLHADAVLAEDHRRMLLWEVNRIGRALLTLRVEVVLLKGAAYAVAGLPPAEGRFVSDVDLLVQPRALPFVEATLLSHGWERAITDAYDQRYYREWMHELPPLRHRDRLTIVDVHHALLPRTSRLYFDATPLWDKAVECPAPGFKILAPTDMVLHCAVHLFHDGDLDHGLRDLVDLHELLTHFGRVPDFWHELVARSQQFHLNRPLYYTLRYCKMLLGTAIPSSVDKEIAANAPVAPVRWTMDRMVFSRLSASKVDPRSPMADFFARCLLVRSHWLRMPPRLLLPHLMRKSWRLLSVRREAAG